MTERREIAIPFSGFYETHHSAEIDRAIDDLFHDHATGNPLDKPSEWESLVNPINYREVLKEYAKEYAACFATYIKEECKDFDLQLEFDSLESPREYNFVTDRIFCTVPLSVAQAMLDATSKGHLAAAIADRFTPRPGFIPFYGLDALEWLTKPLADWDHNELGTLLQAFMVEHGLEFEYWTEHEIMERPRCNGFMDDLIWSHMTDEAKAIVNTWDEQHNPILTRQNI